MFEGGLHPAAKSVVKDLFLKAAEEDYLVARWSAQTGLAHQFAWSAAQSIEKSLKCGVLLSRTPIPASGNGHDLLSLAETNPWPENFNLQSTLTIDLPNEIVDKVLKTKGGKLYSSSFSPKTVEEALLIFASIGQPSSRYRANATTKVLFADIHTLDAVFFKIHSTLHRHFPCDAMQIDGMPREEIASTLTRKRFHNKLMICGNKHGSNLSRIAALTYQNAKFFPELLDRDGFPIGGLSVTNNSWPIAASNADFFADDDARNDLDWVINNMRTSKVDRDDLLSVLQGFRNET